MARTIKPAPFVGAPWSPRTGELVHRVSRFVVTGRELSRIRVRLLIPRTASGFYRVGRERFRFDGAAWTRVQRAGLSIRITLEPVEGV
jgi:hypothetical protein